MIDSIRKPFLFLAVIFVALAVLVEIGATILVRPTPTRREIPAEIMRDLDDDERAAANRQLASMGEGEQPPGYGLPALALVDILYLQTIGLMALSLLIGHRLHARLQGVISLVISILVLFAAFKQLLAAFIELMIRVSLLLAVPFGTIAYMAMYGFFDRTGAATLLGLSWFLKIAAAICIALAHQRFLKQKGLLLMVLTSFLASFIVSFLHALPPRVLVNITDPIAAIVCHILAIIWGIFFLIFGIIAVVKALKPS